jgi:hypothetical protein
MWISACAGASEPLKASPRSAPVTMPPGLRSAVGFAACTFTTLLPAPGASAEASLLSTATHCYMFHIITLPSLHECQPQEMCWHLTIVCFAI